MPRSRQRRRSCRTYILLHESLSERNGETSEVTSSDVHRRVLVLQAPRLDPHTEEAVLPNHRMQQLETYSIYARPVSEAEEAFFAEAERAYQQEKSLFIPEDTFPDDGYDYEQHFRERGDGVFIPAPIIATDLNTRACDACGSAGARDPADPELASDLNRVLDLLASDEEASEAGSESEETACSAADVASADELTDDFVLQANAPVGTCSLSKNVVDVRFRDVDATQKQRPVQRRPRDFLDEQFDSFLQTVYADHGDPGEPDACTASPTARHPHSPDVFDRMLADFEEDLRRLRVDPTKDFQRVQLRSRDAAHCEPSNGMTEGIQSGSAKGCRELHGPAEIAAGLDARQVVPRIAHPDQVAPRCTAIAPRAPPHERLSDDNNACYSTESDASDWSDHWSSSDDVCSADRITAESGSVARAAAGRYAPQLIRCVRGSSAGRQTARELDLPESDKAVPHLGSNAAHGAIIEQRQPADAFPPLPSGVRISAESPNQGQMVAGNSRMLRHGGANDSREEKRLLKAQRRERRAVKKALKEAYSRERHRQNIHRHLLGAAKVSVEYRTAL
jgi:hypothetical protein